MNLEIDEQAELAAELEVELESIIEDINDNFDWKQYGAEITESVTQHAKHETALIDFMRGDMTWLNAICADCKRVVVERLAKEQQKGSQ